MAEPGWACPSCHGGLVDQDGALSCGDCGAIYSKRDGIPIFSEAGDPDDLAEMAELVEILEAKPEYAFSDLPEHFRLPNRPYHAGRAAAEQRSFRGFFDRCPELADLKILDISCGVGREAQILLSRGARRMTLLDVSFPAVRYARSRMERFFADRELSYAVGDAGALPFEDGSYDLVLVYASAHHYPDMPGFLAEARRVASRTVLLSEPAVMGLAQRFWDFVGWNTEYGGIDTHRLDERRLKQLSAELGMSCETERLSTYFPKVLDRFGHSRSLVSAWFLGLRLLDDLTPAGIKHSMNYYSIES